MALAFNGPSTSAGAGAGALGVDSSNNVSVGTSTTQAGTKLLSVGSTTDTSAYALKTLNSSGGALLIVRNDGSIAIATGSFSPGAALTVNGTLFSTNGFTGTISAANVTPGIFNGATGGNYAFNGSLGVATTTQVGLPQTFSVYGGARLGGNYAGYVDIYGNTGGTEGGEIHILGSTNGQGYYLESYNNTLRGINANRTLQTFAFDQAGNLSLGNSANTFLSATGTSFFNAGYLGIGAATASYPLDVVGTANFTKTESTNAGTTGANITYNDTSPTSGSVTDKFVLNLQYNKSGAANQTGYENNDIYAGASVSAGSLGSYMGVESRLQVTGGNVTSSQAFVSSQDYGGGGGTIGTRYGFVANDAGRAVGTQYGLYVAPQTSGATNYAIYSGGGTNYFGGNVGIGTATPTSTLTVAGVVKSTTGGFTFPDGTTQTTAANNSVISAANVSAGTFGSNTGGGNYVFPGNVALTSGGSNGSIDFVPGGSDYSGYIDFNKNGPTRIAYLGYKDGGSGNLGLNLANSANFNINGGNVGIGTGSVNPDTALSVAGAIQSQGSATYHYYNVASMTPGTGTQTGTIKFTMPKYGSATMLSITIKGYDYSGSGAWSVLVGGYNYIDHNWYNNSVQFEGRVPFTSVRLGNDGSHDVLLLGTLSSSWSYSKIEVSEVIASHSNLSGWGTGWSSALLSSESGLSILATLSPDIYTNISGNVGIGNGSPAQKLDVNGNIQLDAANPQIWSGGSWIQFPYGGYFSGGTSYFQTQTQFRAGIHNDSAAYLQFDGGTSGYSYFNGSVGIGTTTPASLLHVNGSTPVITISDTAQTSPAGLYQIQDSGDQLTIFRGLLGSTAVAKLQANNSQVIATNLGVQNTSSGLFTGTNLTYFPVSGNSYVNNGSNFGIGTTTPGYKIDVVSGGATTARFGTASSDTVVVGGGAGKVTAGTYDPPYTINGEQFATYNPGMTGQKEGTAGTVTLKKGSGDQTAGYTATLDFGGAAKGSDLWLFANVTNLPKHFDGLVVSLTPSFDGTAWYEKDATKDRLIIHAVPSKSAMGAVSFEVSYQLTAPRFDSASWSNIRTDGAPGLIINN